MKKLSDKEKYVIINKGTEAPFSGEFYENNRVGKYFCKQCGALLFSSKNQFDSGCGWPSFDDELSDSVKKIQDKDGRRVEILCKNCDGHLGHIFHGEEITTKNVRYCVNSISLDFKEQDIQENDEIAYFAAGCFWGVEYYFQKEFGVKSVRSGYMGGGVKNPNYEAVCKGDSGHLEVVEIIFDRKKTNFEKLCKLFFEIHDQSQENGQGPDIGSQYLSAIFFANQEQKETALKLIEMLQNKGLKVTTILRKQEEFWPAELYHQGYYEKNGKNPYCHKRTKKFD